ncbi:sulfite exporter TauE/SafE family protein [Oceanisphaera pacifica]|uniref:Probable membrane transporter protein n=1 Tax=Oceanisphaera pacifica TaxID=2818389 RepID=A0ABS3NFC9_9GAMM|nr:sulfite exporter TauE/SafE family protein [Oceanisphaera pacifica]MBO1518985.1 sulfite exporter TauE/SafE family protein [Oceanisphaera pacifica]
MINFIIEAPWLFLIIAGVAGYFQTVTGFGLGMIVMGLAGGLAIAPMTSVAAVVSIMTLINCMVALPGRLHYVHWPSVGMVALGIIPTITVGVLLLNYLSGSAANIVKALLGLVIVYAAAGLLLKPSLQQQVASRISFVWFGGLSGFLGGLFGIAGPPLIYHYYRQPLDLIRIRTTLILLFAVSSGVRTLFVVGQGQMNIEILTLTAWTVPIIAMATWVGRHWPPPFSAQTMLRLVFFVLMLIGVSLIVAGLFS